MVGVGLEGEGVLPRLQHVGPLVFVVVGGHVLHVQGEGDSLALPGLEQPGLGEGPQHHAGLLDAAGGVRWGIVQLHHVLARRRAGVGDRHVHRDDPVRPPQLLSGHRPAEAGVAQTIAEGVHHRLIVVDKALCRRRLVVAVAHINPFLVLHEIAAANGVGGADVGVLEVPEVHKGGVAGEVGGPQPGGAPRRVHRAGHGVKAGLPRGADPHNGVHALVLLQLPQLHGGGGVDKDDHRVEVLLGQGDGVLLILVQLQLVLAGGVVVVPALHVLGEVASLAPYPADGHNGRVPVGGEAGDYAVIALHGHLADVIGGVPLVHGDDPPGVVVHPLGPQGGQLLLE